LVKREAFSKGRYCSFLFFYHRTGRLHRDFIRLACGQNDWRAKHELA